MDRAHSVYPTGKWPGGSVAAYDGTIYGPPSFAKPWGVAGCPLVPRMYRLIRGTDSACPSLTSALQVPNLTLADLDANVLMQADLAELPLNLQQDVKDLMLQLPLLPTAVAIPAGLPLSWLTALPISPRVINGLRRRYSPRATVALGLVSPLTNGIFKDSVQCDDFLNTRNVGILSLVEVLCVLESAELGYIPPSPQPIRPSVRVMTNGQFEAFIAEAERKAIHAASSIGSSHIRDFATWALSETGARTFQDAILCAMAEGRPVTQWDDVANLPLTDVGDTPKHPYDIIESWVAGLSERYTYIFTTRISRLGEKPTLQDLATQLGISRERVRQIEKLLLKKFLHFTRQAVADPIRWRVETIQRIIGVAAPLKRIEQLLPPYGGQGDYLPVMLFLAGPYDLVDGWLVLKSAAQANPLFAIRTMADDVGRIDFDLVSARLTAWGLDTSLHGEWLTRDAKVRWFKGQFVLWGTSTPDRLVFALSDLGRPATVEALMHHLQEDKSIYTVKNALSTDVRMVRVTPNEWALASWDLPTYDTIATSIYELLQQRRSPLLVTEVVASLRSAFGLAEQSVRTYCQAPMFILEGGAIRLRTDTEPYTYPEDALQAAPGVFALGQRKVALLLEIDRDLLRGSGRKLGFAASEILGLGLGDRQVFQTDNGHVVSITFLGTSSNGPFLGSVRSIAENASAQVGQYLTLILNGLDMSALAIVTDTASFQPSWQLVAQLTGVDGARGVASLAEALQCPVGEVHHLLRLRGDTSVLSALPADSSSLTLQRALTDLEDEIRRGRE